MARTGHQTVLILDFGSQLTQLIARRVREQDVYCEILPHSEPVDSVAARRPAGIILSGGPMSVVAEKAPGLDAGLLDLGVPILGICYGSQLITGALGGEIRADGTREYGHAELHPAGESGLLEGIEDPQPVWMSHADEIVQVPEGFRVTARTADGTIAAFEDPGRAIYGLLFHPEVSHTPGGPRMLGNFVRKVCGCAGDWTMEGFVEEEVGRIRKLVGERGRVILGLSGGVDSSVAALLIHRAVGDRLAPVFIDTGLLRKNEGAELLLRFRERLGIRVRHRESGARFLRALKGIRDPEEKRKAIGRLFIDEFEEEARAVGGAEFLAQGTLYPDRIESASVKGPSATIKTHHNVGGLPDKMNLKLLEPLRDLFKDEVRALGRELGLDPELAGRHPFPGPGLAVRIVGEVTREKVALLQEADAIFIEEIRSRGLYDETAQAFAVLLPVRTVGVMGDARTYENVLALRCVNSTDFMTAEWSRLPADLLARTSERIINEVRGVNRVVYDISNKPPATIEWE